MDFNPIILSIPLFFFLLGVEILVDNIQKTRYYRWNDAISNINIGIGQQTLGLFFKILIPITSYELIYHHGAFFKQEVNALNFVILFIAYDFLYYWAHRMSHEINLFWGGHVVHHQSEDYNLSVALRQSWFQFIFTTPFYIPLALLGYPTEMLVWVSAINLTYQFWIHTELIDKMGFLEWFMNTPSHHRVHHGRNPKYIDKNHAGVFIIWDRMFGTFQVEEERPTYGITTPLNSFNPIWANFSHFKQVLHQTQQTQGWKNKWKVLFNKTGWRPAEEGGPIQVPEVSRDSYQKYHSLTPGPINWYAFFQYLLITAGTLAFMLSYAKLPWDKQMISIILIIWSIWFNSVLFEGKVWLTWLEPARLLISAALIAYLLWPLSSLFTIILAGMLLLSLTWFWGLKPYFPKIQVVGPPDVVRA